jgi:hypothetical protein
MRGSRFGKYIAIPIIGVQMLDGYRAYLPNPAAPPVLQDRDADLVVDITLFGQIRLLKINRSIIPVNHPW